MKRRFNYLYHLYNNLFSTSPKIDGKLSPNEYDHYINLSNGDFRMFWKIVGDEVYILMIGRTKGYVALGIAPTVKSGNADYIIGSSDDPSSMHAKREYGELNY